MLYEIGGRSTFSDFFLKRNSENDHLIFVYMPNHDLDAGR